MGQTYQNGKGTEAAGEKQALGSPIRFWLICFTNLVCNDNNIPATMLENPHLCSVCSVLYAV